MNNHDILIWPTNKSKSEWSVKCSGCSYRDRGFSDKTYAKVAANMYHQDNGYKVKSITING